MKKCQNFADKLKRLKNCQKNANKVTRLVSCTALFYTVNHKKVPLCFWL